MNEANKFTVDLRNIEIRLPENKIIVDRQEYYDLQHNTSQGRYMTLSDVLELLSVSRPWLLDNVLYNPNIRKEIDIDMNPEGFVKYPQNQGGRYFFLASKTKRWFEENFQEIL
ncbi:hypothetical protein SCODD09_01330 [Streptococcus constellatus]|nr:hypothetical protein SCODD09_01330 [Streptococcus constellatus]